MSRGEAIRRELAGVPEELLQLKAWCGCGHDSSKPKRPDWVGNPEDERNHHSLAEVCSRAEQKGYTGAGIITTIDNRIVVIDLDHITDNNGALRDMPYKENILAIYAAAQEAGAYIERSFSGHGLHIVGKGASTMGGIVSVKLGDSPDKKPNGKPELYGVELFTDNKFVRITGRKYNENPNNPMKLADISQAVKLTEELISSLEGEKKNAISCGAGSAALLDKLKALRLCDLPLDDEYEEQDNQLIEVISMSAQGETFAALYGGDIERYGNDHSRADAALLQILAWWTAPAPATAPDYKTMARIFRRSALFRDDGKHTMTDYLPRSIASAASRWAADIREGKPQYDTAYRSAPAKDENGLIPFVDFPLTKPGTGKNEGQRIPVKKAWKNVEAVTVAYGTQLIIDDLTGDSYIKEADEERFKRVTDDTVVDYMQRCSYAGYSVSRDFLADALHTISNQHRVNAWTDKLEDCATSYNLKPGEYIKELFGCIEINPAHADGEDFYYKLFRMWMIRAARMAYNGIRHETGKEPLAQQGVICLQGGQGIGKSSFFRSLAFNDTRFYQGGGHINPTDRDSVKQATSKILFEIAEAETTLLGKGKKPGSLKAFLDRVTDTYRRSYGRVDETHPRITTFFATVNEEDFLNDRTGNRRWWCIPAASIERPSAELVALAWGEAMEAGSAHERDYLNSADMKKLEGKNQTFAYISPEEAILLDKLAWNAPDYLWVKRTAAAVTSSVGLPDTYTSKVAKALRRIGKEYTIFKSPTNNKYREYVVPPTALGLTDTERAEIDLL